MSNTFTTTTVRNQVHSKMTTVQTVFRMALMALFVLAVYAFNATAAHADSTPLPDDPTTPLPHLVLHTESLAISYVKDAKNPFVSAGIAFLNDGKGGLRWNLFVASDYGGCPVPSPRKWMTLTPEYGFLQPGEDTKAQLTVDARSLAIGTHNATLCLGTNDPANAMVSIPVTITVKGAEK